MSGSLKQGATGTKKSKCFLKDLKEQRPLVACAGQLCADRTSDSCLAAMEFSSTVAVGVACLRLLLQYGRAISEGKWPGGCFSP